MKLIVGLGNPGREYAKTRHNAGFIAIDMLLEKYGYISSEQKFHSDLHMSIIDGEKVYFMKPLTYMNASGQAIRAFMDYYNLPLEDLVVIHDDKDFAIGKIQFKSQGSSAGHNGIKSIIQYLNTEKFNRIRIGVGNRPEQWALVDWVLSKFTNQEYEALKAAFATKENFVTDWIDDHNFNKIMSLYNN